MYKEVELKQAVFHQLHAHLGIFTLVMIILMKSQSKLVVSGSNPGTVKWFSTKLSDQEGSTKKFTFMVLQICMICTNNQTQV